MGSPRRVAVDDGERSKWLAEIAALYRGPLNRPADAIPYLERLLEVEPNAIAPRAGGGQAAPAFACPHCGARLGAGRLARADAFRRARWRHSRRGAAATPPPDAPPAACPLPAGPAFTLREARPHWCYPAGAAWCRAGAAADEPGPAR